VAGIEAASLKMKKVVITVEESAGAEQFCGTSVITVRYEGLSRQEGLEVVLEGAVNLAQGPTKDQLTRVLWATQDKAFLDACNPATNRQ
jgi:hypothetical protein